MTLPQALSARSAQTPGRLALAFGEARITFGELEAAVDALAAGLAALGVRPGDRVALLLPTCPQFVISYFAVLRAGAIVVPLHCLSALSDAAYIVENAGATALIALDSFAPLAAGLRQAVPSLSRVIISGEQPLSDAVSWEDLLATPRGAAVPRRDVAAEDCHPTCHVSPGDTAVLIYTSGTTGRPKGAMLSHRNLLFDALACCERFELSPEDVFLSVLPLFHSFGATVCMILPILAGASSHLMPRFAPERVLAALEATRTTLFAGVPSMYAALLVARSARPYDLSALRICVSGGAPMPAEVQRAFGERFGVALIEGYGPTEASPVVSVNPLGDLNKLGSVGPPLPGVDVRIVDDVGVAMPTDEVGEITVRGDNVMQGYWHDEALTGQTLCDGWLFTGDMGFLDADGYLHIVDRKKDMVIVAGMNVYPREVEDIIYQLAPVAEAAVVGVPNPLRGEDVKAFVALKEGQSLSGDEIVAHCARHLARYKVPRLVEFRPELPKSDIGKILKRALRDG